MGTTERYSAEIRLGTETVLEELLKKELVSLHAHYCRKNVVSEQLAFRAIQTCGLMVSLGVKTIHVKANDHCMISFVPHKPDTILIDIELFRHRKRLFRKPILCKKNIRYKINFNEIDPPSLIDL